MRIGFASDIHHPSPEAARTYLLLQNTSLDALVLAGDAIEAGVPQYLHKLLSILDRTGPNRIVAVLGNHEHYLTRNAIKRGLDSHALARRIVEEYEAHGVPVLDARPQGIVVGGVGLAGCVGWYDYTLAPPTYPREAFETCNPYGYTLEDLEACVLKRMHWRCPQWWRNDCITVRLPFPHRRYVERCVRHVTQQIRSLPRPTILVYHHVPRPELLAPADPLRDFDYAYAGSILLDRPVQEHRPDLVVYGHVHDRSRKAVQTLNGVTYANAYPHHPERRDILIVEARDGRVSIVW